MLPRAPPPLPNEVPVRLRDGREIKVAFDDSPLSLQIWRCCHHAGLDVGEGPKHPVLTRGLGPVAPVVTSLTDLKDAKHLGKVMGLRQVGELSKERVEMLRKDAKQGVEGLLALVQGDCRLAEAIGRREYLRELVRTVEESFDGDEEMVDSIMAIFCELFCFQKALEEFAVLVQEDALPPMFFRRLLETMLSEQRATHVGHSAHTTLYATVFLLQEFPECARRAHDGIAGNVDVPEEQENLYPDVAEVLASGQEDFTTISVAVLISALALAAFDDGALTKAIKKELGALEIHPGDSLYSCVSNFQFLSSHLLISSMMASTENIRLAHLAGRMALLEDDVEKYRKKLDFAALENKSAKSKLRKMHNILVKMTPFLHIPTADDIITDAVDVMVRMGQDQLNLGEGRTILHYAAEACSDPDVVELVHSFVEDPEKRDDKGRTPLDAAQAAGRTRVVVRLRLLKQEAEEDAFDGMAFAAVTSAVPRGGTNNFLSARLQRFSDLPSPLEEAIRRVLRSGWPRAWPNGFTVVHLASKHGHAGAVGLLVDAGGAKYLLQQDDLGLTPMDYANQGGHQHVVLLIQKLAAEVAIESGGHEGVVARLGRRNPRLRIPENLPPKLAKACAVVVNKGWDKIHWPKNFSPLHIAAQEGNVACIQLLLEASAAPGLELCDDDNHRKPLDYAIARRHGKEVLDLLQPERDDGVTGVVTLSVPICGGSTGRSAALRDAKLTFDSRARLVSDGRASRRDADGVEMRAMWRQIQKQGGTIVDEGFLGGPLEESKLIACMAFFESLGPEGTLALLLAPPEEHGFNLDKDTADRAIAHMGTLDAFFRHVGLVRAVDTHDTSGQVVATGKFGGVQGVAAAALNSADHSVMKTLYGLEAAGAEGVNPEAYALAGPSAGGACARIDLRPAGHGGKGIGRKGNAGAAEGSSATAGKGAGKEACAADGGGAACGGGDSDSGAPAGSKGKGKLPFLAQIGGSAREDGGDDAAPDVNPPGAVAALFAGKGDKGGGKGGKPSFLAQIGGAGREDGGDGAAQEINAPGGLAALFAGKGGKGGAPGSKGGSPSSKGGEGGGKGRGKAPTPPPKVELAKPTKAARMPRVQLKKLWWTNPTLPLLVFGRPELPPGSVWDKVGDDTGKLNIDEFEAAFEDSRKNFALPKPKQEAEADPAKKADRTIRIITDDKLRAAIETALRKVPKVDVVAQALREFDDTLMTTEDLDLVRMYACPTEDQLAQIEGLRAVHPDWTLGCAEQFMMAVGSLGDVKAKAEVWHFVREAPGECRGPREALKELEYAVDSLMQSTTLPDFLGYVLATGNYLNAGTNRGQADGFHLTLTFAECLNCKGKDETPLAKWIIDSLHRTRPALLGATLRDVMPALMRVGRMWVSKEGAQTLQKEPLAVLKDTKAQIEALKRGVTQKLGLMQQVLKGITDVTDPFKLTMQARMHGVRDEIDSLCGKVERVTARYASLLSYFALDSRMCSGEFCLVWDNFFVPGSIVDGLDAQIKKAFAQPAFVQGKTPRAFTVDDLLVLWGLRPYEFPKVKPATQSKGDKAKKAKRATIRDERQRPDRAPRFSVMSSHGPGRRSVARPSRISVRRRGSSAVPRLSLARENSYHMRAAMGLEDEVASGDSGCSMCPCRADDG